MEGEERVLVFCITCGESLPLNIPNVTAHDLRTRNFVCNKCLEKLGWTRKFLCACGAIVACERCLEQEVGAKKYQRFVN